MLNRFRAHPIESGLALAGIASAPVAVLAPNGLAVVFAAAAAIALIPPLRARQPLMAFGALSALLSALVVWMFATVLWSPFPANVYQTLIRTLPLLFGAGVLLTAVGRFEPADAERAMRGVILGFALLLLLVAVETLGDGVLIRSRDSLLRRDRGWSYTMVSQALVVASLMVWPVAIALWRRGLRHLAAVALVLATALPFTAAHFAARGAILLGLAGFGLVWLFGRRALLAIGGLAVSAVALAPLLPFGPLDPAHYTGWLAGVRNSAMHRLYIWRFTAERVSDHPVLGWGLNAARSLPGGEADTPVGGHYLSLHPHNAGLQVWVELGPVGALLAIGLLIVAVRAIMRLTDDRFTRAAAAAAFAGAFFVAEVSFGIWQSWWLATLTLLACWLEAASRVPVLSAAPAEAPSKPARRRAK